MPQNIVVTAIAWLVLVVALLKLFLVVHWAWLDSEFRRTLHRLWLCPVWGMAWEPALVLVACMVVIHFR